MPVVVRLHLEAQANTQLKLENAPPQGWFLALISQCDPTWGHVLHPDPDTPELSRSARPPYTVSPFYTADEFPLHQQDTIGSRALVSGKIRRGQILSLRLTLTQDTHALRLFEYLHTSPCALPRIGNAPCRLLRCPTLHPDDPDSLAVAWQHLAQAPPAERLFFEFTTPVAFVHNSVQEPLPHPERLFTEWRRQWQHHTGFLPSHVETLPDPLPLRISQYRLETQPVRLKSGLYIGFVGSMELTFAPRTSPEHRAALTALASLTDFCGLGVKTTMGMGQVRLRL